MLKKRILYIDDDEDLCDLFGLSLTAAGYEMQSCSDPAVAVQHCHDFQPDLVLMDLMLPETSGDVLFQELRDAGIQSPIAFVTATTSQSTRQSLIDIGAAEVIVKPVKPDKLIAIVGLLMAD